METIEEINKKLSDYFGLYIDGSPRYRVVFSEDQLEKRKMTHTNEGFQLIHPEVREVPKYRHYIKNKHVLEQLTEVIGESDLTKNLSYEPVWVFEDGKGNALPPKFAICKIVIEEIYQNMAHKGIYTKYKNEENSPEKIEERIKELQDAMFGNETSVGDSLAYKEGVFVPSNYEVKNGNSI